jgi:hypothetical protein
MYSRDQRLPYCLTSTAVKEWKGDRKSLDISSHSLVQEPYGFSLHCSQSHCHRYVDDEEVFYEQ